MIVMYLSECNTHACLMPSANRPCNVLRFCNDIVIYMQRCMHVSWFRFRLQTSSSQLSGTPSTGCTVFASASCICEGGYGLDVEEGRLTAVRSFGSEHAFCVGLVCRATTALHPPDDEAPLAGGGVGVGEILWRVGWTATGARRSVNFPRLDDEGKPEDDEGAVAVTDSSGEGIRESMRRNNCTLRCGSWSTICVSIL